MTEQNLATILGPNILHKELKVRVEREYGERWREGKGKEGSGRGREGDARSLNPYHQCSSVHLKSPSSG